MSVLDEIVHATRLQLRRRSESVPLEALERTLGERPARRAFGTALRAPGVAVIAEHKRRSPSAGTLGTGRSVSEVAAAYERGGAAALSILTEEEHFGGSLADLRTARAATGLPVLRKDFIVDRYQLYESALAGADAVLLIAAAVAPADLRALHREATELDLEALVEVHDRREIEVAGEIGAELIGINNRDLTDFTVNASRTPALLAAAPAGAAVISESGVGSPAQLEELARAGVDGVLVGGALMRAADPEAACRALADAGRPQHGFNSS